MSNFGFLYLFNVGGSENFKIFKNFFRILVKAFFHNATKVSQNHGEWIIK